MRSSCSDFFLCSHSELYPSLSCRYSCWLSQDNLMDNHLKNIFYFVANSCYEKQISISFLDAQIVKHLLHAIHFTFCGRCHSAGSWLVLEPSRSFNSFASGIYFNCGAYRCVEIWVVGVPTFYFIGCAVYLLGLGQVPAFSLFRHRRPTFRHRSAFWHRLVFQKKPMRLIFKK